jgi:hypothetical protein
LKTLIKGNFTYWPKKQIKATGTGTQLHNPFVKMKTILTIVLLCIFAFSVALPIHKLKNRIQGEVLVPGDEGYDEAVVIDNGYYNYIRPKAVVIPDSIRDIQETIKFAKKHKAKFTVKGGGHSAAGTFIFF